MDRAASAALTARGIAMGEALMVQCDVCQISRRCDSRNRHFWDTARYWAVGAEVLPCRSFVQDKRIEIGYVPRSPLLRQRNPEIRRVR